MMPLEMSCMPLFKKVVTLYGESGGMLLCQKFNYELIFT
jgi:hypothetical protein